MVMTKEQAERETLRQWKLLPIRQRMTFAAAQAFATTLESALEFRTMGNKQRVIASWIIRDLDRTEQAGKLV